MTIDIRTVKESDLAEWVRALNTGFHRAPTSPPEEVAVRGSRLDLDRTRGAFDGDRCVATFRSMPRELTVPGGAVLPASAVTNVSVTSTHRRRGLASRMMAADLADAKARGDAVSILIAAEYPIYGRFGFGPATWVSEWSVDVPRAQLDRRYSGPEDGGRVDLAAQEEVRRLGPDLHDRFRAGVPGAINRPGYWWEMNTGQAQYPGDGWREPYWAFYRNPAGEVEGLAAWVVNDREWRGKLPHTELAVLGLTATTAAAEGALWRFLLSLDWIARLRTGFRPPDDVLPLLLGDPRAALVEANADFMWLRLLDVPVALSARTYAGGPASLVLEVRDEAGLAGGRFRLETAADGTAVCAPVTAAAPADADLSMDVGDLACLYLGDESASRLAALGRVTEHRAGAVAAATGLFRTPRRPWCPDVF
ncbi:GNAT family N-acetyltransferase [Actinacidiphila yeochonensis]|uniref:GNAT family N-acetyltransferase n=1 Tax=Actinacidiphila yeochonensis TaxID=89050 RepID=UPI00055B022D|nr:GNAT family N-acetyltransferase [Actinacidiphila yeochonensis]